MHSLKKNPFHSDLKGISYILERFFQFALKRKRCFLFVFSFAESSTDLLFPVNHFAEPIYILHCLYTL